MSAALPLAAMIDAGIWDALRDLLLLLVAAMALGTVALWLRQSVIVGYLIAGTIVGPNVLGLIHKQQEIYSIAEMGVALLLFVIGLEFSPRRLLDLGRAALGTGVFQILVTIGAVWGIARLLGLDPQQSLVIGMMIAMSSTACVLRLLTDRAELDGLHGRTSLGILLVQDVAVVPMMLTVTAMAGNQTVLGVITKVAISVVLIILLITGFALVFKFVVPVLFRQRVWQRNRDLPILLGVILALGSAWSASQLELSPALGAFAGGVLLAISPFATQVRADVRPLSTVLVTLFFASIGMFGDPVWLAHHWVPVTLMVIAIVVGKPLIIAVLSRCFGQPWRYSIATGLCLAQIGEFSFVLATIAQTEVDGAALMDATTFRALVSATIITLLLTPYLVAIAPASGAWFAGWIRYLSRDDAGEQTSTGQGEGRDHPNDAIVIVGFGPAGQRVAEVLMGRWRDRLVVIDLNPDNIRIAHRYGLTGILGDATQTEVLEHAGILRARIAVIVLPDHATTKQLIYLIRDLTPSAMVLARCRYHVRHWELLNAGAFEVADEEVQVGRLLAHRARVLLNE